ncbi:MULTISPECIES: restriction endonuclease subunit S [Lactococcus]|nr:restriction endonuclease subunit S [Lactococcus lactis]UPG99165.1 restriction endonuclease subunit S [Lactococcus lactis]
MMSKKSPQLRFEGFTDDWEERKLGDFLKTPEKVKAHIQSKDDLMTLKLNLGGLESGSNRETLELGSTIYYKRKAGQFIYGKQNFFNGSMAIIPIDLDGKATSGDVPSLDVVGILSEYLYVYVSRGDYWKSKEAEASGTGSKRIHEKILQGFDIKVPSTQNEQTKIGSLFKQLDNTITIHQRKLDLLKEQKKGYLQKMFPKNGAKVPELRFAGFADDWEERKLSDIVDRFDNLRVPITASDRKPGDTPYYGANGIQDYVEGFTHNGEFILVAEDGANDLKNYPVQYVNGKVWVNNHAHVLQGKKTITDNKFLMNAIKNFNIEPFLVGGGRAKLNADVMMKLNILLPTFVEQEKIGSLFSLLDKTIALHQRKLDLLKEQKKGFLQKMFV